MEIRTLANIPLSQITAAFNEAFNDYFIPLQFTDAGMAAKMKGEGITYQHSIGAFDGSRLVGFMLHGFDLVNEIKTVYNAGTGVVPSHRGRSITKALYRYAIPLLAGQGIRHHLLEVIDNNHPAKRVYDAVGFRTVRSLVAFKGSVPPAVATPDVIRQIDSLPDDPAFCTVLPSWQNSLASINRDRENHVLLGAFRQGQLVGYAAYVPAAGRLKQIAVHRTCRRQKTGTALMQHMAQSTSTGSLLITNVDESCPSAMAFFRGLQFNTFLRLNEMKMEVPAATIQTAAGDDRYASSL